MEDRRPRCAGDRGGDRATTRQHVILPVAEELVWRELFRQPDSRHAQWTLWEIYANEPTLWTRAVHETGTQAVQLSPDNRLLLTAGRLDGVIHVSEVETGRVMRTMVAEPRTGIRRAFFTADGTAPSVSICRARCQASSI